MYDRSSVCTKQLDIMNDWYNPKKYVISLLSAFFLNRNTVSNFQEQSLYDVEVDSVSITDFCIVCAGKNWPVRGKLARRPCNTTQLSEITFSPLAIRNIARFALLIRYSFASLWKFNQRVTGLHVPSFIRFSVDIILQWIPPKSRAILGTTSEKCIKRNRTISNGHIEERHRLIDHCKQFCNLVSRAIQRPRDLMQRCRSDYA